MRLNYSQRAIGGQVYNSKYFKPEEYLPKGYSDTTVMDPRILQMADEVRDLVGLPMTINAQGRQFCGWRPKDCNIGAKNSYHKKGMAVDLHCAGMKAEDVRVLMKKAISLGQLQYIGGIELEVSWCHIDCRARVNGKVLYFKA